eukprot:scaffold20513_cov62-Phaeocystis_antarctica.AAC.3
MPLLTTSGEEASVGKVCTCKTVCVSASCIITAKKFSYECSPSKRALFQLNTCGPTAGPPHVHTPPLVSITCLVPTPAAYLLPPAPVMRCALSREPRSCLARRDT